ncbi:hypothetical protein J6397_28390 [Rhodococcus qingshengii]|uniref:hypothetical protein n=1 Tax=Rhodococcus qingshengii TaxID=334542 RepID=UPI001AE4EA4D|nr:hypothetical protein [Rhodococcus qingshengii]MBP1054081.1 hypothetical protein [Rhodococcus qingshengii]
MTRRIEHIVTLDPDDFEALHTIYTNKGNADPIVNAYRRTLRATTPTWLPTTNSPLTRNQLKELITSINTRRNLITTLDDSDTKTTALTEHDALHEMLTTMLTHLDRTTTQPK